MPSSSQLLLVPGLGGSGWSRSGVTDAVKTIPGVLAFCALSNEGQAQEGARGRTDQGEGRGGRRWWGLLSRRPGWRLTGRGWFVVGLTFLVSFAVFVRCIHPFLAVTSPVESQVLVVEGWVPDYALEAAVREADRGGYVFLCVTGGPLERGLPLSEYKTYAALGAAVVESVGVSSVKVQSVPAPHVRRDRTYASALAVRDWFDAVGERPKSLNVVSLGPHSRRTRLLYRKAFGDGCDIGVIAVEHQDYDPGRWWAYSQGVREVVSEVVGYVYARFFFDAGADPAPTPNSTGEDSSVSSPEGP